MTPLPLRELPKTNGDLLKTGVAMQIEHAYLERALYDDARAFLARPGKAVRARLIEGCYALAGGCDERLPSAAVDAIELLHGGSLIVDDIQDDAEYRRGAPALHRMIGTPRALNTGNWLYFVALERLDSLPVDAESARTLTRAAHRCFVRCHEGQALDLALRASEVRRSEFPELARLISGLKTGTLTAFSCALGGILAGAESERVEALSRFGYELGVGLQMLDDLGGLVDESRRHKALEDLAGERVNWAFAWASETLDELTFRQLQKLLGRRDELGSLRDRLSVAVESLGRMRVRAQLHIADGELHRAFAPGPMLERLAGELVRLEKSYG